MIDLKRFFLERQRELIVFLAPFIITTTLSGCAKREECANSEEESGYKIVQFYPYYVDGKTYSGKEDYDFVKDKSLGEVVEVTREYYNNNIKK